MHTHASKSQVCPGARLILVVFLALGLCLALKITWEAEKEKTNHLRASTFEKYRVQSKVLARANRLSLGLLLLCSNKLHLRTPFTCSCTQFGPASSGNGFQNPAKILKSLDTRVPYEKWQSTHIEHFFPCT